MLLLNRNFAARRADRTHVRPREDVGITVSYWQSLEAIAAWKANLEHREAQKLGRERWYSTFRVRICKVEREYGL